MNTSIMSKFLTASLTICLLLGVVGCASNDTATTYTLTETSGFLTGYFSRLQSGLPDRANLFYVSPTANWSQYKKMYIKPIELWTATGPNSRLNKISPENQQLLADYYFTSISNALRLNYRVVDHAGPDVLVIRAALTEPRKSSPITGFVSGLNSPQKLADMAKQKLAGTGIEVGSFVMEIEILDGENSAHLVAELDTHSGTAALRYNFRPTWGDIQQSFDWWTDRLATCLREEKEGARNKSDL